MRAYLHLFFSLLMPLGALFIIISIVYFKADYDLTKAMKLGVLTGIFIAIAVTFITSVFLTFTRYLSKRKSPVSKKSKTIQTEPVQSKSSVTPNTEEHIKSEIQKSIDHKIMLLMDKELAFEVTLQAIKNQKIGDIGSNDVNKGLLAVHCENENIQITITPLTKHTSQIILNTKINSKNTKKLITYIKEKELSFLEY